MYIIIGIINFFGGIMKNLGIKSQKFIDAAKRFHGGDRSLQVLQDIKYGHSSRPLADIWIDDINAWRILPRLNWIKKNLQNFNKNIKILDVGSWTGVFANEIYKEGFGNITCLDISKNVCSFGEKAFPHLNFICEDIEDFTTSEKYDLILLCEILEHITEPIKTLKKISQLLTENGSILSTIPDENYVEYDFSRGFVEHFNPIPKKKLSIFSPNIETLPIFDDYYWYCLNFSPTI